MWFTELAAMNEKASISLTREGQGWEPETLRSQMVTADFFCGPSRCADHGPQLHRRERK